MTDNAWHCAVCEVPLTNDPAEVGDVYELARWDDGLPYCPDHYAALDAGRAD